MQYQSRTWRLMKWLEPFIDVRQFSIKRNDCKERIPVNTIAQLNTPFARWTRLTKTHLERHLSREATYFYVSKRSADVHLLMIDIDAHDGEEDAWQAARWIVESFFPGVYWEPSTDLLREVPISRRAL